MTVALLGGIFLMLMMLRVPIAFCIGLSALAAMLISLSPQAASMTLAQRIAVSSQSFTLMAIPMFILAGKLLAGGGVARRLIRFAQLLLGRIPGGLAAANVLANMLFGSVSGSAAAAASSVGSIMIPEMEKNAYPRPFSASLTSIAAVTGLLIPPSNVFIIYSLVAGGISIGALFLAGYAPGILLGLALIAVGVWQSVHYGFGIRLPKPDRSELIKATLGVLPSVLLLFLIMGGIVAGWFTATEASVVAVLYAAALGLFFYKEVKWADFPGLLVGTASTTGMVFFLIGTSDVLGWVFAYTNVPELIKMLLAGMTANPFLLLLVINVFLLLLGTFMDVTPALLIFTPIFLPVMVEVAPYFGLTDTEMVYHFGVVIVFNLCLGLVSPPAGTTLFIAASIGQVGLRPMMPYLCPQFLVGVAVLMLVSYFPAISLWLPRVMGLIAK
jgi:tripartite ATP-independent transporter DctM subunit